MGSSRRAGGIAAACASRRHPCELWRCLGELRGGVAECSLLRSSTIAGGRRPASLPDCLSERPSPMRSFQ
eukprot:9076782-Pyramimonas_sp.AAC.1